MMVMKQHGDDGHEDDAEAGAVRVDSWHWTRLQCCVGSKIAMSISYTLLLLLLLFLIPIMIMVPGRGIIVLLLVISTTLGSLRVSLRGC